MKHLAWIIGLSLLTCLAYSRLHENGFVYEDAFWTPSNWSWQMPSRALSSYVWVNDPQVMHAQSLTLHLVNGTLVYVLATSLGFVAPWLAMAVFLLHPIQTEAVAYASAHSELWVTLGLLIAAIGAASRNNFGIILVIVGSVVAMMGKENGVVVVGIVPLVWWVRRQRIPIWIRVITLVGLAYIASGAVERLREFQGVSWLQWWQWEATAVWTYIDISILPFGAWLNIDHDFEHVAQWVQIAELWSLLVGIATIALLAFRRWHPRLIFGLMWILIVLAPRFAVRVPLSLLNEHHVYPAFVGVSLVLSELLGGSDENTRAPVLAVRPRA